jgi:hypothetical protein
MSNQTAQQRFDKAYDALQAVLAEAQIAMAELAAAVADVEAENV